MRFFAITTAILVFSHQVYADCSSLEHSAEEMSFYSYMSEEELKKEYCTCTRMEDHFSKQFKETMEKGYVELTERILADQTLMSGESKKIARVLSKDYGVSAKEVKCPEFSR